VLAQRCGSARRSWTKFGMPQVCMRAVSAGRSALRLCAAGDLSSDLSWYSKRVALAAVYGATELFMITGASSPGRVCSVRY
jgi:hypothetical protein